MAAAAYYFSLGAVATPSQQLAAGTTPEGLSTAATPVTVGIPATTASPSTSGPSVLVTSDQLGVEDEGSSSLASWAIQVQNAGTVPVSSLSLVLNTSTVASMCTSAQGMLVGGFGQGVCTPVAMASPLQPGRTISGGASLDEMDMSVMPMVGTVYTLTVVATYSDGSVTSGTYYVTAEMGMNQ